MRGNRAAAKTAALSRDHTLLVSPSGLVTLAGGKWTTYRRMGEDTIDHAAMVADLDERPSPTAELRLHGWAEEGAPTAATGPAMARTPPPSTPSPPSAPTGATPLHPRLPYRAGEVVWAVRHEMARTVEDVLARRTRALLLDARASAEIAPAVAALMADGAGTGRGVAAPAGGGVPGAGAGVLAGVILKRFRIMDSRTAGSPRPSRILLVPKSRDPKSTVSRSA